MIENTTGELADRIGGFLDRMIVPENTGIRSVIRTPDAPEFYIAFERPYRRGFQITVPTDPIGARSKTYVEQLLYAYHQIDAEMPPIEQARAVARSIENFSTEMRDLTAMGYSPMFESQESEPFLKAVYDIRTPTEMRVRQVLTDFLRPR